MFKQRSQQGVEGRVEEDIVTKRCIAPFCGKVITRTYKSLYVCNEECWNKYLTEQEKEKQKSNYAVPPEIQIKLHQHNMGRGYPSLGHFERAFS